MKPYLVIDTNIILLDANNILTLGKDYTLVLPETILDEVESKKSSIDPNLRYQVREFGRILTKEVTLPTQKVNVDENTSITIVPSTIESNIRIETVSCEQYPKFATSENDSRIIYIAKIYATLYGNVTFMTNDIMCGKRARAFGLNVIDLKLVNTDKTEFTKKLSIPSDIFNNLHNKLIIEVDPEHKVENYNYIFSDETTGQVKLANTRNGYIDILGKDTEKELRRQDISPKNTGQLFLTRAIQNPNIDIILCEASAGTGL